MAERVRRRRPPFTLAVSGIALLLALVFFVLGRFELGIGALVFHWLMGAVVLARRRPRSSASDQGSAR